MIQGCLQKVIQVPHQAQPQEHLQIRRRLLDLELNLRDHVVVELLIIWLSTKIRFPQLV